MYQVQKDYKDLKQKADQNETRARRDHKYNNYTNLQMTKQNSFLISVKLKNV